jgi:alpha-aminoadipate carrier protein LysW
MMTEYCIECNAPLEMPKDALKDEIISCPDCGLDYLIVVGDDGKKELRQLTIDGEDWGE